MSFNVTNTGDTLTATSTNPALREVEWTWSGGPYIEYGLPGAHHAAGVINVHDYKTGTVRIPYTVEAFSEHLDAYYSNTDNVEALGDEIAHAD